MSFQKGIISVSKPFIVGSTTERVNNGSPSYKCKEKCDVDAKGRLPLEDIMDLGSSHKKYKLVVILLENMVLFDWKTLLQKWGAIY